MGDTPYHVEALYRSMFRERSPAERLRMACEMFDTAVTLIRAGLGDLPPRDLRRTVFLRLYGEDPLPPALRDAVLARIDAS